MQSAGWLEDYAEPSTRDRTAQRYESTVSIVETLQRVRTQGLVLLPPKSAKSSRAISLDAETVEMLREHRGKQVLLKMELGDAWHDHGLSSQDRSGILRTQPH